MPSIRVLAASAALLVAGTAPAFAYIDPVTGSFLIQGLIGGAAALLAGIRSVRVKVMSLFGFKAAGKPGLE